MKAIKKLLSFHTITIIFLLFLITTLAACGFNSLPEDFTSTMTSDTNLASFSSASGTVTMDFVEGEMHISLSEIPNSETGCMYMAYATTGAGTMTLGMFTLTEEPHETDDHTDTEGDHDEDGDDHNAESETVNSGHEEDVDSHEHMELILYMEDMDGDDHDVDSDGHDEDVEHMNGDLEVHSADHDFGLSELQTIEVYYECNGDTVTETEIKLFNLDLTSGETGESEESGGGGGHDH